MAKIGTWMKALAAAMAAAALVAGCETSKLDDQGTITLAELQGIAATNAVVATETEAPATEDATPTADEPAPTSETSTPAVTPTTSETAPAGTPTNSLWPAEITGTVKFTGPDVSGWAVTASLDASVGGGTINMPYSKARVWPAVDGVNANPWAIVNIGGQWYAGTFEYLRHGQTSKPMGVLDGSKGDHFKVSPLSSWRPRSGERFGLMVSGLARGSLSNVKERSNVDMVTWP